MKTNSVDNSALIEHFYTCFSSGDFNGMMACYHPEAMFHDNAFGTLKGERIFKMWEMLLLNSSGDIRISFNRVKADSQNGSVYWKAEYAYGKKKRKVVNNVWAKFKFKDGKIIRHNDNFDLWNWTKQALGPIGYALGWTSFMKSKIQQTLNKHLDNFIAKQADLPS